MNASFALVASALFALAGACGGQGDASTDEAPSAENADAPTASSTQCMAYLLQTQFAVTAEISAEPAALSTVEACLDTSCERFPLVPSSHAFGADPRSKVNLSRKASLPESQLEVSFMLAERPKGTRAAVRIALLDETGATVGGERATIEWDYAPWNQRSVPQGSEAFSCHTFGNIVERSSL